MGGQTYGAPSPMPPELAKLMVSPPLSIKNVSFNQKLKGFGALGEMLPRFSLSFG